MLSRLYSILVFLAAVPAWCQAGGGDVAPAAPNDTQMATPPPVSGQALPTEVRAEVRTNYLRGGVTFATAYIDNLYAGNSPNPISETTYTILPRVSVDATTPRRTIQFSYKPGFTFYQPTSLLNEVDQSAMLAIQYRPTLHTVININDAFQKSATSFGPSDSAAEGAISGSPQALPTGIIAPFAQRLTNNADGHVSYQFSPVGMIGVSGTLMKLRYPDPSETAGLYDSDVRTGSGFYNRRISAAQYVGANYQYSRILTYPPNGLSETHTQSIYGFYTIYPKPHFSISVSGGPQHYTDSETSLPASSAWGPIVMASANWQGMHTNVATNFARQVTGGGGLLGAFVSTTVNGSARWQVSRTWTIGGSGGYATNKSVSPLQLGAAQAERSISASATIEHPIGNQLTLLFEYDRLHQADGGIAAIANNPNSDRGMISLAWEFARPLGR